MLPVLEATEPPAKATMAAASSSPLPPAAEAERGAWEREPLPMEAELVESGSVRQSAGAPSITAGAEEELGIIARTEQAAPGAAAQAAQPADRPERLPREAAAAERAQAAAAVRVDREL
jgi:hypothetical protein